MHTYSARPEYPSTVFVSHGSSTRHEASFHTERSRERTTYRRDDHRPTHVDVRERTPRYRDAWHRDVTARTETTKPRTSSGAGRNQSKPVSQANATPSRNGASTGKPRAGTSEQHVVLMPEEPAKPKPNKDRARVSSFRERLKQYVDKTNEETAQKERERQKRIRRAIGAAADEHD